MKTTTENSVRSVPCRHLRTKRMYIPALADGALDIRPVNEDQSFYWCNQTLGALSLNDEPVHPCVCQPGRGCHES